MPQVKCEYCGAYIEETAEKCPNCGGVNANFKRIVDNTPRTIDELKEWYMARKLPPESVTRFFIGKDIREPRAFGIYKDGSNYIVYKNKNDGSRAVRYKGTDEAYAVNEIYLKLKSEILNQKSRSISKGKIGRSKDDSFSLSSVPFLIAAFLGVGASSFILPDWLFGLAAMLFVAGLFLFRKHMKVFLIVAIVAVLSSSLTYLIGYKAAHRHDGYYQHGNTYYYTQGNDVYYYVDDDWYYYDTYDDFTETFPDYTYVSGDYDGNSDYEDFSDSYYYNDFWEDSNYSSSSSSSSSDHDSDYDWDSGSDWDSGGTDWDSDW